MNMKHTRSKVTLVGLRGSLIAALILSGNLAFAQSILITNLVVPGATSLAVSGLNDNGQVAGYFYTSASAQRAYGVIHRVAAFDDAIDVNLCCAVSIRRFP